MQVRYVAKLDPEALLDAEAPPWQSAARESVRLVGTPSGMQPTAAIRVAWQDKPIGAVEQVEVSAIHDGERIAFRLEWEDPNEDGEIRNSNAFPDGAAIALPAADNAPIITMGAPGLPVNAWFWRADEPESARQVKAEGLGTSETFDLQAVRARGTWKEGRWRLVLSRSLQMAGDATVAQLAAGATSGFGVAIWEGSHSERGGIKAFSGDWMPLELEPAAAGGRTS